MRTVRPKVSTDRSRCQSVRRSIPKNSFQHNGAWAGSASAACWIFFSTHVLEVAEKLCDKVAIIKGGRLIRSGTMEEVKGDDSLEEVFLELEAE